AGGAPVMPTADGARRPSAGEAGTGREFSHPRPGTAAAPPVRWHRPLPTRARMETPVLTMLRAHMVAALVGPTLVRRIGRNAFYPLAVVPGASAGWLATLGLHQLAASPLEVALSWLP